MWSGQAHTHHMRHRRPRRSLGLLLGALGLGLAVVRHATGQSCESTCPDIDASGTVEVADLLLVLAAFGRPCAAPAPARPPPAPTAPPGGPPTECGVAIIGGGPGGAYVAWRLAM